MKVKNYIAAILAAVLFASPVSATESSEETVAEVGETVTAEQDGEKMSDSKKLGGLLMVGAIVSASWISMLIFKGSDKTKYL